jgi:hypothetical protein
MNEGSGQSTSDLTNQNDATLGGVADVESIDPICGNKCCEIPKPESTMCLSFDGSNDRAP